MSGPSFVSDGQVVAYELALQASDTQLNGSVYVIADVPLAWHLRSSLFHGTLNSMPMSIAGSVVPSSPCDDAFAGEVLPGYQRFHISVGPFGVVSTENGAAVLEFDVGSQPAAEYPVFFRLAWGVGCSRPAVRTINPTGRTSLPFVESSPGSFEAVRDWGALAVSSDGRHVFAVARNGPLDVFSRHPGTGRITLLETHADAATGPFLEQASDVVASFDGRHVYVSSVSWGMNIFSRNTVSGELAFVGRHAGLDAWKMAIAPDGRTLYATFGDTLYVVSRDETSGDLRTIGAIPSDLLGGDVEALADFIDVAVSPDGLHVYTVSEGLTHSIAVFSRDLLSGELSFEQALSHGDGVGGLLGADFVTVSGDGKSVYSGGAFGDYSGIGVFVKDEMSGRLTFLQEVRYGSGRVYGLETASALAVSPSGHRVFAAGANSIAIFVRDRTTGELTFLGAEFDDDPPNEGLDGLAALAMSPSGRHLYGIAPEDDAVTVFAGDLLFVDGFESGDVSVWSGPSP